MDDTWRRILKRYSDLNLDFLDEDSEEAPVEGVSAPEAEIADTVGVISAPPTWVVFILCCFLPNVYVIGLSYEVGHFCRTFRFFFNTINEIFLIFV